MASMCFEHQPWPTFPQVYSFWYLMIAVSQVFGPWVDTPRLPRVPTGK